MIKNILCFYFVFFCLLAQAQDTTDVSKNKNQLYKIKPNVSYIYGKPKKFSFIKNVPKDLVGLGKSTVKKKSLLPIAAITLSTLITYKFDNNITNACQTSATSIGWNNDNNFYNASRMSIFHGKKNLRLNVFLPEDFPTTLYFLGDGMTSLLLSGGFYLFGALAKDNRALTTSNELTGVVISMGIVTQTIKRITGRESPIVATSPRGTWRPFPGILEYTKNTPHYDAFPSGHMATAVATLTIIAANYPDYKMIKPVGVVLVGLMGYQMVQTRVHWTSDYPLAIVIGYVMGKNAVNRGRTKSTANNITNQAKTSFLKKINVNPFLYGDTKGLSLSYKF